MKIEEIVFLKIFETRERDKLLQQLNEIREEIPKELKEIFLNCLNFVESSSEEKIRAVLTQEDKIL